MNILVIILLLLFLIYLLYMQLNKTYYNSEFD
jgi:hypothetical protein